MKLSILDYSEIAEGETPEQALAHSVRLARLAEGWGYHRYWVSEHHGNNVLAGSAPEILAGAIAAGTHRIRTGSGGVMLPMHSPFKVAESFAVLAALYPGRIDLGVGRSTGGPADVSRVLLDGRSGSFRHYPDQIARLAGYVRRSDEQPLPRPVPTEPPDLWLLGSSSGSAEIAARHGMGLAFGHFISGQGGPEAVKAYREQFVPAAPGGKPQVLVSAFAVCGETDEQAEKQAGVFDDYLLNIREGGGLLRVPSIENVAAREYTPQQRQIMAAGRGRMLVGGPERMKRQLIRLADRYNADEIMLATVSPDFGHKCRMYELLAEVMRQA